MWVAWGAFPSPFPASLHELLPTQASSNAIQWFPSLSLTQDTEKQLRTLQVTIHKQEQLTRTLSFKVQREIKIDGKRGESYPLPLSFPRLASLSS